MTPTLIHDNYQNHRRYNVPKAQLIIADIPYNIGGDAYASNPQWYVDGDNKNGESALAGTQFFNTDSAFKIPEFLHFASRMPKPEMRASSMSTGSRTTSTWCSARSRRLRC